MFIKILIGIIFITFNFRIQGIALLPDFVGYIFIFLGLNGVSHLEPKFNKAKTLALVLIFLSVPGVYEMDVELDSINAIAQIPAYFIIAQIISFVAIILYFFFAYNLFMGLHDLAVKRKVYYVAKKAETAWKIIIITTILAIVSVGAMLIMLLMVLVSGSLGGFLVLAGLILIVVIGLFVISIVSLVFQIQALNGASKYIENAPVEPTPQDPYNTEDRY